MLEILLLLLVGEDHPSRDSIQLHRLFLSGFLLISLLFITVDLVGGWGSRPNRTSSESRSNGLHQFTPETEVAS